MKKLFFAAVMMTAFLAASCQKESKEKPVPGLDGVVGSQQWELGGNDASISLYDTAGKSVDGGMFLKANAQNLGDLGQDILRVGDELYIAVSGSRIVFVTDMELKIKKAIETSADGSKLNPRSLAQGGWKSICHIL